MTPPTRPLRLVFCVAAPAEARAVALGLGIDPTLTSTDPAGNWTPLITGSDTPVELVLLQTGVGKVNAAACLTAYLTRLAPEPPRRMAVFSVGVCGCLPGTPLTIGQTILATISLYADEGIATPAHTPPAFTDMAQLGFPYATPAGPPDFPTMGTPCSPAALAAVRAAFAAAAQRLQLAPIATVSTCSGTDALAATIAQRTGAWAEAMEGAAVGHVLHRLCTVIPELDILSFCELRTVSNTTGDRDRQQWNLSAALAHLTEAVRVVAGTIF